MISEWIMCDIVQMDYLKARDILTWLKQLPHAYITVIFDCEQNFVLHFGKQREPEIVEILEDPWRSLTSLNTSTVVYYLQPDIRAMAQLRRKDVREATGMLTRGFHFALSHCLKRRGGGGAQEIRLSHRRLYEGMSLYWHRQGRMHRAFVPAVRVRRGGEEEGRGGGYTVTWENGKENLGTRRLP